MYYCVSNIQPEKMSFFKLKDGKEYSYSVKEVELKNSLGTNPVCLLEYYITNSAGEVFVLHRTKDGNWYETQEQNRGVDARTLHTMKLLIESLY